MNAITQAKFLELSKVERTDAGVIELFISMMRSPHTKVQYRHSINMLVDFVDKPLPAIDYEDAVAYHEYLKDRYESAHSVKLHINVARALFTFGVKINHLRTNVFAPIKPDAVSDAPGKRILAEEDVLRLIDAPKSQRDKLILRLLYAAGLRVSELCNLTWDDLSKDGVLHVRYGKGQKDRYITLSDATHKRLQAWRGEYDKPGYIFPSQVKERQGVVHDGRLSEMQIHRIVKKAAKVAKVDNNASAHWLRHSHGSHALDRGASVVTVRDTLGHASISTTNKYLHGKRNESSALHLAV